ncbi:unnamed protein product [Hapterophycus canaliculatus]
MHATPPLSRNVLICCVALGALGLRSVVKGNIIGSYYASNCYEVGGGNMGPLYLKCAGCQYVEAFECLRELRANKSKNVPTGCGINALTVQPDPTCCPVFENPDSQQSVYSSTSAYPDALLCLEDAGCEGDTLHTELAEECFFNQCNQQYACVAAYSGTRRIFPAVRLMVLFALAVARVLGPGG